MTKNKLVWRLSKLPSVEELLHLVNAKLITQDEAKEILFKTETDQDRDEESLKAEIKFLRELAEKLAAANPYKIVETIRYIEKPYTRWDWIQPYYVYCSNNAVYASDGGGIATTTLSANASTMSEMPDAFTSIKTF